MTRTASALMVAALMASTIVVAQRRSTPPGTGAGRAGTKSSAIATCTNELGSGVSTRRRFCDVLIAQKGTGSVALAIPAHTGNTTLRFDLHNRFTVPAANQPAVQAFARHVAVAAIVGPTGTVIDHATVTSEIRSAADLFDLIAGAGPGGVKAIGPGRAESYAIALPGTLTSVGIVGLWLDATTARGRELFDTPGRPVAIISAMRVEYAPAR